MKKNSIAVIRLWTETIIANLLICCLYLFRPLLGPMNICPYTIGCTQYALDQLSNQRLIPALYRIINRIIQCHPWGNRKI